MELSPKDIADAQRIIDVAVANTCRQYNLRKIDVGEDMAQTCWVRVLRVKDAYDPTKSKFTTYIWLSVHRDAGRFARQYLTNRSTQVEIPEHLEYAERGIAALETRASLKDIDLTVVAYEFGYTDAEISEMLDIPVREVTQRRRLAQREIRGQGST